jgi:hypothetical protein
VSCRGDGDGGVRTGGQQDAWSGGGVHTAASAGHTYIHTVNGREGAHWAVGDTGTTRADTYDVNPAPPRTSDRTAPIYWAEHARRILSSSPVSARKSHTQLR